MITKHKRTDRITIAAVAPPDLFFGLAIKTPFPKKRIRYFKAILYMICSEKAIPIYIAVAFCGISDIMESVILLR
jgi:hypothetical protein